MMMVKVEDDGKDVRWRWKMMMKVEDDDGEDG